MRKLSQLDIIREVSTDFPNGAIINETDINDGTPVIREVYNDILVNLYRVMDLAGIPFDGTEDKNEKYQLVEALRKLPNLLNDVEQVLTYSGGVWSVPLLLDTLPDKYVFFARAADDYISGTFVGTGSDEYTFSSAGFSASDELMVVVDQSGVRAYSLNGGSGGGGGTGSEGLILGMGIPLAFNEGKNDILYYREEGNILTDAPGVGFLEQTIRFDSEIANLVLTDIFAFQNNIICAMYNPDTETYLFYSFSTSDFTESTPITVVGFDMGIGTDYQPYFYADENNIYVTNGANLDSDDAEVVTYVYSSFSNTLTYDVSVNLGGLFVKTTNAAVKARTLYTLVGGVLKTFNLTTGTGATVASFNGNDGNLFRYKEDIYFTPGNVAKKWF